MSDIPDRSALRFGIPSLDDLFGTFSVSHRSYGIPVAGMNEQIKLTIIGPAGSGKSILALHLASRYRADAHSRAKSLQSDSRRSFQPPKVIYISTDLTLPKARLMWTAFALDHPNMRDVPLFRPSSVTPTDPIEVSAADISLRAELREVNPNKDIEAGSFAEFMLCEQEEDGKCQIGFLDLVTHPAGDLWTFTNRLLGALEPLVRREVRALGATVGASSGTSPAKTQDEEPDPDQPLIIIDNVDGFETHVGELNTFGEPSSVRARIVQAVQAARLKAHLVFLAEESGEGSRSLQDVSDVVIRLRIREERGYRYRAVEIEKARAQAIHRGDHYLLLRTGTGSTTALQENADDPRATNAYVQVIPSLHTVGRRIMNESNDLRLHAPISKVEKEQRAGFGLRFLDELCGKTGHGNGTPELERPLKHDALGLEHSSLTAVVGDTNTYKTILGHKFLRRSFELFAQNLSELFNDWHPGSDIDQSPKICKVIAAIQEAKLQTSEPAENVDPKKNPRILDLFKAAEAGQQVKFLTKLLLHEKARGEEWWIPQTMEKMLEQVEQGADPRVTVVCGRWALRLLTNRLKSHIHDKQTKRATLQRFERACLPDSKAFGPLYSKFFDDEAKITREDFLNAAVAAWVEGRDRDGLPPVLQQWEIEKSYKKKESKHLDLVQQVIAACRPDNPTSTQEDFSTVKEKIKAEWKSLSAGRFLHEQYRGSTEFLLEDDLKQLSEEEQEVEFPSPLLVRIFVGCATRWIDYQAERSPAAVCKWLDSIPGLKALADGLKAVNGPERPADQKPLTLQVMAESMLQAMEDWATGPDMNAAMYLALQCLSPAPKPPTNIKDLVLQIPGIIDDKLYSAKAITAKTFAEWLFYLSPPTHPFGARHGQEALADEIQQLLDQKRIETPVLCSVLVGAILQLVRLRHLRIYGRMDDELRERPKATGDMHKLSEWLAYIHEVPGANPTGCKQAIETFVNQVVHCNDLTLENLHELVKAITQVCGAYVTSSSLESRMDEERLRICQLILEEAARVGLTDGPSILITANTLGFDEIREQFNIWLGRFACNQRYNAQTYKLFTDAANDHLQKWLIVRRLEVHFLPTATLSAIIRANVELAESLLKSRNNLGERDKPNPAEQDKTPKPRTQQGGFNRRGSTIRLVIDGLGSLKQTYPNVFSDSLFLPSLKLFADREHLSVLVIVTQKGRPDMAGADAFERETMNFFPNQIRTWWIEFFGELRVAISLLPPAPARGSSTIRELAVDHEGELQVLPHFELYKGIESGQPRPVPLEVRFIVDNPKMQAYQDLLSRTFSGVFPEHPGPQEDSQLRATKPDDYGAEYLRDFGRLHGEAHLDQTLVIQLKEFWAFQRSQALHCQSKYLLEEFADELGSHAGDPLQVFSPTIADRESAEFRRRFESFVWNGYFRRSASTPISQREHDAIDRVPFTWDFGFLLCNRSVWKVAEDDELKIAQESYPAKPKVKVKDVWGSLPKIVYGDLPPHSDLPLDGRQLRSWRLFAEAVVLAARHGRSTGDYAPALDVPVETGDMLMCLLLEIWASEVYQKFFQRQGRKSLMGVYFDRFTKRSWLPSQTQGLIGLIAEPIVGGSLQQIFAKALGQGRLPALNRHSVDLFKTILLLCEMLDITKLVQSDHPFNPIPHPVTPEAVCSRHSYATACQFLADNLAADAFIPVRLPGHFSVRGDTYLAIARGSHSSLLGERALDLLSSRRGNDERLRKGIGLPVRGLGDREGRVAPRTALCSIDQNGRRSVIRYSSLIRLGSHEGGPDGSTVPADSEFKWLWRSTLGDYDAQSREFQRGVTNILQWWNGLRTTRDADWKSGLHLYDAIDRYYATPESDTAARRQIFDENFAVYSLWEFPALCDELADRLRHATPRE